MGFTNQIHSEITIDGTAEDVWVALVDFERYPEWNPGFQAIHGVPEVGATLEVTFAKDGGKGMTIRPTVLVADAGRELRWLGRFLVPGLFDGEHRFELHEEAPGKTRFVQAERFRGLLVPFMRRLIEDETASMFERTNRAMASRVSSLAGAA
jgi:hypothetical protein